jgi:hypothetical protein
MLRGGLHLRRVVGEGAFAKRDEQAILPLACQVGDAAGAGADDRPTVLPGLQDDNAESVDLTVRWTGLSRQGNGPD